MVIKNNRCFDESTKYLFEIRDKYGYDLFDSGGSAFKSFEDIDKTISNSSFFDYIKDIMLPIIDLNEVTFNVKSDLILMNIKVKKDLTSDQDIEHLKNYVISEGYDISINFNIDTTLISIESKYFKEKYEYYIGFSDKSLNIYNGIYSPINKTMKFYSLVEENLRVKLITNSLQEACKWVDIIYQSNELRINPVNLKNID